MSFKTRACRRGDAEGIKGLLAEIGFAGDANTVTWIVSHPEMELIVATDALDKAIGFVALSHRPNLRQGGRVATIDDLVVAKAHRRHGVGKELLKKAVDRAKVLDVRRLEIQSLGGKDDGALVFLKACGFSDTGVLVFKLGG